MNKDRMALYDSHLSKELKSLSKELNARIQRTLSGPIAPNAETYFNVRKFRKDEEIFSLAILSWYLEPGFGELLRMDLESKQMSTLLAQEILWILCSDKQNMLEYLSTYSERTFFGNWLPKTEKVMKRLNFITLNPNPAKRKVRRRGYRDHGSCRPESRWLPSSDWSFDEMMQKIETERQFRSTVQLSIERFGLLGVRLPQLERISV